MCNILVMFVFVFLPLVSRAADGDLDTTFNPTGTGSGLPGTVVTTTGGVDDYAVTVRIQADGKILAGGLSTFSGQYNFTLVRYNTNGSLDTTFNPTGTGAISAGIVETSIGTFAQLYNMILQPDGKIVAVGYTTIGGNNDFALARYNPDGSLDTTFNPTGIGGVSPGVVVTNFGGLSNDFAYNVKLQPDGKIIAIGESDVNGSEDFALARYNLDGSLDTTFNPTGAGGVPPGTVVTNMGGISRDLLYDLVILPNNKLLVCGSSNFNVVGGTQQFALARYNPDGSLDTTFNPTGIGGVPPGTVMTNFGPGTVAEPVSMVLFPDGKVVTAGYLTIGGITTFGLAKYNSDGSLDTTFNPTGAGGVPPGTVSTLFAGSLSSAPSGIVLQPDGKVVVSGDINAPANGQFALARYNLNGSLDTTFNPTGSGGAAPGTVITVFPGTIDNAMFSLALQLDSRIVGVGRASFVTGNKFDLARYQNSAPLVPTTITFPMNNSVINNNRPTITGTAQNPSIITLFIDGVEQLPGTVTLGVTNQWTYVPPVPLSNGAHTIVAVSYYQSGNVSAVSSPVSFVIDTVAPPAPVIIQPANGSTITSTTPTVSGTALGGAVVVDIAIDGIPVVVGVPVVAGVWSYTLTNLQALSEGSHTVSVIARDALGNASASAVSSFTVAAIIPIPAPPVITQPINSSIVTTLLPTIAGTADILAAAMDIFIDGVFIARVPVINGLWSYTLTSAQALSEGFHSAVAVAINSAGAVSAPSNRVIFEVLTSRISRLSAAIRAKYCPRG